MPCELPLAQPARPTIVPNSRTKAASEETLRRSRSFGATTAKTSPASGSQRIAAVIQGGLGARFSAVTPVPGEVTRIIRTACGLLVRSNVGGANKTDVFNGRPDAERETIPVNPPSGVTVRGIKTDWPRATVAVNTPLVGATANPGLPIDSITMAEALPEKSVLPP